MCLYPKLIRNKKYLPSKKNNWCPPTLTDSRVAYITAACGKCLECRQQKQRQWLVRMSEELRENPNAYFITLTIDDKNYKELKRIAHTKDDNEIATKAIRLMLERIRKKTGKSIKHWFITELGHEKTERLHLHGIVWGIGTDKLIEEKWQYGFVFTGTYVSEKTINYITKYMTKVDKDHKDFVGKVLCSKGIGIGYCKRADAQNNKYKPGKTNECYRMRNGAKINLPIYYRNQLYTEEERELLFIDKIEKGYIYVLGQKVHRDDTEYYEALLKEGREKEYRLNGMKQKDWDRRTYINRLKRQKKKQEKAMWELQCHLFSETNECPF